MDNVFTIAQHSIGCHYVVTNIEEFLCNLLCLLGFLCPKGILNL